MTRIWALSVVLLCTPVQSAQTADQLVIELGQFRDAIPPTANGNGRLSPIEARRRVVYDQLWTLGSAAIGALNKGLADPDVRIRRNVALFLCVAGGNWYD